MKDLLNPVKVNDLDTHEVIQPGEIEALTAAEVATAIKQLNSGKAAGGDEIRPEMLKSLAWVGILWLTRVCQLPFKLGKTPKDWQTGVIIPIYSRRRVITSSVPTIGGYHCSVCLEKCMPSALKEDVDK